MIQTSSNAAEASFDRPQLPRRGYEGPWIRRAVVFVSCALALNALIGERGLAETIRARKQLRQTTAELAHLRRQNAGLLKHVERLRSDRQTIEHIARAELGLIRRGEVLVILKDVPAQ